MLNRNAEALFWVGRYMERAENHARLIDVHYHIQHEGDFSDEEHKWARLIDALGARSDYLLQFDAFTERDVLSFITLDRGYINSLFSCVSRARTNLRTLREKLPGELWEVMNSFYLWLGEKKVADILSEAPYPFYKGIKERAAMFLGMEQSVMLRENEWHFIESGRFLERAENTVRILQSVVHAIQGAGAPPYPYLQAVLKSVSAQQSFRRHYADAVAAEHIIRFLIESDAFPRSVRFSFAKLEEHLAGIELDAGEAQLPHEKAVRQAAKVRAELACLDEEMSMEDSERLLHYLMNASQKLGKGMAAAFFRIEEASA
ncbi:alpha-E domain-containing protein [Paenibacillus sp. S-38]|uniref:alpha-E domain-containing protein n=1 Tax=Paenibacillus sp. S-38 TaxID=3416710 RepID=UPI003CE97BAA